MNRQSILVILLFALGLIGLGHFLVSDGDAWPIRRFEDPVAVPSRLGPLTKQGLPNLHQICPGVYSGGQPEGATGFASLAELGVKRVISVDGARPKLELASRFALSYVHLPQGYGGVPPGHARKLAKALQSAGSPVYVHCHSGQHRAPAAAAVACVGLDWISVRRARRFLEQAGTSPRYQGLYRSVDEAKPFSVETLRQTSDEFPSFAPAAPVVESMVKMEQHFDTLQQLLNRGGGPPADQPDLNLAHQALLLEEKLAELLRNEPMPRTEYGQLMAQAEESARQLRLKVNQGAGATLPVDEVKRLVEGVRKNCQDCHRTFRD
ncbi:MAG: hypothetical protein MK108_10390 [Mariniblastus sp.]|nr:hypothetical protein [Mariniblastus sp.]